MCFTHAAPRSILLIWVNFCIHSFHQLKGTRKYAEASSLHVLIDVLIFDRDVVMEIKNPGRWFEPPARD